MVIWRKEKQNAQQQATRQNEKRGETKQREAQTVTAHDDKKKYNPLVSLHAGRACGGKVKVTSKRKKKMKKENTRKAQIAYNEGKRCNRT